MNRSIEAFRRRWMHLHEMTIIFAEAAPGGCWNSTPHDGFAPFSKQVRHVVCVRGVYNDGVVKKRIDFSRKHEHYSGGLGRPARS